MSLPDARTDSGFMGSSNTTCNREKTGGHTSKEYLLSNGFPVPSFHLSAPSSSALTSMLIQSQSITVNGIRRTSSDSVLDALVGDVKGNLKESNTDEEGARNRPQQSAL